MIDTLAELLAAIRDGYLTAPALREYLGWSTSVLGDRLVRAGRAGLIARYVGIVPRTWGDGRVPYHYDLTAEGARYLRDPSPWKLLPPARAGKERP